MPRKQKRPEKVIIRRKCHTCGTMKTDPYVYQSVPSVGYGEYPMYNMRAEHTKRMDLKGDKKVITFKKRRRKDSKVKRGFRRDFTRVRITKISA